MYLSFVHTARHIEEVVLFRSFKLFVFFRKIYKKNYDIEDGNFDEVVTR